MDAPSNTINETNSECTSKENLIEKECLWRLEKSASKLVEAISNYGADMSTCMSIVPDNPRLKEIETMVTNYVKKIVHPAFVSVEEEDAEIVLEQDIREQANVQSDKINKMNEEQIHINPAATGIVLEKPSSSQPKIDAALKNSSLDHP